MRLLQISGPLLIMIIYFLVNKDLFWVFSPIKKEHFLSWDITVMDIIVIAETNKQV